ncbi:hypothetical protein [Alkalihalobacterium elongatum]|uniref:hypothetical protein n=1 Tax=Alkalihalobacterium elongatum TaxID=2675466 RepID=UPI001C1F2011|nr:hypothetical protein [Alkalihalobacterium elongatum]
MLNPNQEMIEVVKQKTFNNYDHFVATLNKYNFPGHINIPRTYENQYTFSEGTFSMLTFTDNWDATLQSFINEGEHTQQKVLFKTGQIEDQYMDKPSDFQVTLSNGTDTLHYEVKFFKGLKHFVSNDAYVDKIMLNGDTEAFYIEDSSRSVITVKMENGIRTAYTITAGEDNPVEKSEIIRIAESLLY